MCSLKLCAISWSWKFKSCIHYSTCLVFESVVLERGESKTLSHPEFHNAEHGIFFICWHFKLHSLCKLLFLLLISCICLFTTKFQVLLSQFCYSSELWFCLEYFHFLKIFYISFFICGTLVYSKKPIHACYYSFSFSYTYFVVISPLVTNISLTSVNFKLASGELCWASEVYQKMSCAHFQNRVEKVY